MTNRGLIKEGMVADIVVFDADTITDKATFVQPTLQSEGIVHTIVNGQLAWKDGQPTNAKAGQIVLRDIPESVGQ